MHSRQRSPGNGYRSMMMMGSEGSSSTTRGPSTFYVSEYQRHVNRDAGFGRGQKSLSRKGDVFVEAGRLAAEYLVSQGLLPPNALSSKWNKKHVGEAAPEGRTSALARLGNPRKIGGGFDEFGRNSRKRGGFRSNGLDWGRDFRRNVSWSDRLRVSPDIVKDNDDDGVVIGVVDSVLQRSKSNSSEFVLRSDDGGGDNLDAEMDKDKDKDRVSSELLDLKLSSSGAGKDAHNVDMEFVKEVKDESCDDDVEKLSFSKNISDSVLPSAQENHSSGRVCTDLVSLCKSVKVPTRTRTRSLLRYRNLNNGDDENSCDIGGLHRPQVLAENESLKGSSSDDLLSDKTYDLEHLESDVTKVETVNAAENIKELDTASNAEEVKSLGSQSFQDRAYMHDNNQESSATLPEYESDGSMVEERGEKRAAEADDVREETKRMREWLPSLVPRTEGYFLHNNPIGMKESSGEDEISRIDGVTMNSDQGSLMTSPQFTQGGDRSFLQCSEEKQSLASSFRTCDLNLIEASEVHENHVDHPILIDSPASETKKCTVPVDIDLSMSHATVSGEFNTHASSGKEIEVIDLENYSTQEGKSIDNMERKTETMFPGLEGFSNHAQNTADIHDVQNGSYYINGLMISEFLETDFPNCSSVPSDINSVHNEMGLHNGTGTLAEDDSIYMSLGEIPLSFLPAWEQPPSQEYRKPF